jgi:hypothetical protein
VTNSSHHEVGPFGQLIDDGRLRGARIDEFGAMHGLYHAICAAQSRGNVVQQDTDVVFAIVEEPAHSTESLRAPWGESASWSHLQVSEIHKAKAAESL